MYLCWKITLITILITIIFYGYMKYIYYIGHPREYLIANTGIGNRTTGHTVRLLIFALLMFLCWVSLIVSLIYTVIQI